MPQSWDVGHIILLPLRRKAYWGFSGHPKNPTASAGFEPANSGSSGQYANHNVMIYLFFSWTDCGVKFSAKSSLYVHLKKHNKPKSATGDKVVYHCPIEKCTRTYTCKSSLRQHMLKFHTPVLGKWHYIMTVWHHMAVAAKESYIVCL